MSLLIKALKQAEKEHQKALTESPSLDGADGYGGEQAPTARPARAPRSGPPVKASAPEPVGVTDEPIADTTVDQRIDDDADAMALLADEPIPDRTAPAMLPRHAAPLDDKGPLPAFATPDNDELTLESPRAEGVRAQLTMDPLPTDPVAQAPLAPAPTEAARADPAAAQTQPMPTLQINAGHAGRSRLMLMMSGALILGAVAAWLALQWVQPLTNSPGLAGPDDALSPAGGATTQTLQQPLTGPIDAALSFTGTLVAEGSHVASAPFDGLVATPETVPGARNAARQSTPPAASRSAATRAPAQGTARAPTIAPVRRPPSLPAPIRARTDQATAGQARQATPRQGARPDGIRFERTDSPAEQRSRLLAQAYQSLRGSRFAQAEQLYLDALAIDRNSIDAWLGLATLAAHANRPGLARQHYQQALQIDPNDPVARAGLLSVQNTGDPVTRESQLRNLQASGAAGAPMKFSLGNSLAAQQRWPEAQQAYFDASAAEPSHPDYAFNLAIALERIHQPRAAKEQYERALELASRRPASFELDTARQRIRVLAQASSTK